MKKNRMEFLVGASIFFSVFILIAGVMWLKEISFSRQMVKYTVLFPNVGNLQIGDPVSANGVKRGSVDEMRLRNNKVAVTIKLDKNVKLTDSCDITIQNVGLMGERMVGISLSNTGNVIKPNRDKEKVYLEGNFDSGIAEAMGMLGRVLGDVRSLLFSVNNIINETIGDTGFVSTFNNLMTRLDNISYTADQLVAQNKDEINKTLDNLHVMTGDLRKLVELNSGEIDTIIGNTGDLTSQLVSVSENADTIANSLKDILRAIENGEGSIGMLMEDEEFSDNLKSSITTLDTLVDNINKNGLKLRVKLGFRKPRDRDKD